MTYKNVGTKKYILMRTDGLQWMPRGHMTVIHNGVWNGVKSPHDISHIIK